MSTAFYWAANTTFLGHAKVNDGDHLTVLSRVGEEWIPEYVYARATESADRFGYQVIDETCTGIAFYVYEDTCWCRGWVDEAGKQALLAARALEDSW